MLRPISFSLLLFLFVVGETRLVTKHTQTNKTEITLSQARIRKQFTQLARDVKQLEEEFDELTSKSNAKNLVKATCQIFAGAKDAHDSVESFEVEKLGRFDFASMPLAITGSAAILIHAYALNSWPVRTPGDVDILYELSRNTVIDDKFENEGSEKQFLMSTESAIGVEEELDELTKDLMSQLGVQSYVTGQKEYETRFEDMHVDLHSADKAFSTKLTHGDTTTYSLQINSQSYNVIVLSLPKLLAGTRAGRDSGLSKRDKRVYDVKAIKRLMDLADIDYESSGPVYKPMVVHEDVPLSQIEGALQGRSTDSDTTDSDTEEQLPKKWKIHKF